MLHDRWCMRLQSCTHAVMQAPRQSADLCRLPDSSALTQMESLATKSSPMSSSALAGAS